MKHATGEVLKSINDLLTQLRKLEPLKERKVGVFYLKNNTFLHFHEDPTGIYGDVRIGDDWQRYRVSNQAERKRFLTLIQRQF
jgi:hypothetical protein